MSQQSCYNLWDCLHLANKKLFSKSFVHEDCSKKTANANVLILSEKWWPCLFFLTFLISLSIISFATGRNPSNKDCSAASESKFWCDTLWGLQSETCWCHYDDGLSAAGCAHDDATSLKTVLYKSSATIVIWNRLDIWHQRRNYLVFVTDITRKQSRKCYQNVEKQLWTAGGKCRYSEVYQMSTASG